MGYFIRNNYLFVLSEEQYNKLKKKGNETEIFKIINNDYEHASDDSEDDI